MSSTRRFTANALALAVTGCALGAALPAVAQDKQVQLEEVVVTATRRSASVQDIPINIAAISGDTIERQGIRDLSDLGSWVAGLTVVDQGSRGSDRIIVRGLNADQLGSAEAILNDGGGTVATYLGEIPIYIDLKLNDMERVEVLLGPQGTLYGAGTLGGAIRYMPNRPDFEAGTVQVRGDAFQGEESDDPGYQGGLTVNLPLLENLAFRGSLDYLDDPGFIDYDYLVREPGVSRPDPDFSDPADVAANLTSKEDANDEQTSSFHGALRWDPTQDIMAILGYHLQDRESGGRTMNHRQAMGTDDYTSAMRFLEPNDTKNELTSLELVWDLGFAELTSATGYNEFTEEGQRDQTDLLISLDYSYEDFPSFSAYTSEDGREERFNQEIRLVSTDDSKLGWILGAFYNDFEYDYISQEFTPGYGVWLNGGEPNPRPDNLEYYSRDLQDLTEQAFFGELSYRITEAWQVTVGGRYYSYELETENAVDFPLANTIFGGREPNSLVVLEYEQYDQDDDGNLLKFNTSYQVNDDMMVYGTISEGYRIGGSNGLPVCEEDPEFQGACAGPNEVAYDPDETTNYEIGLRSSWLENRLTFNAAVFYIEWDGVQVASTSEIGAIPITINGDGAESQGIELDLNYLVTERFSLRGSYGYADAELTDPVNDLIRTIPDEGFDTIFVDGEEGDRLPGSPEHQGSVFATYALPLDNGMRLDFDYGVTAQSDVLTRTGERGDGEALDGFAIHNFALTLNSADEHWDVSLYVENLLDEYAETGARTTEQYIRSVDGANMRSYYKYVLPPRSIGMRFRYDFDF